MAEMPAALASVWQDLVDPSRPLPPYVAFTKGAIDGLLSIAKNVWVEGNIHPLDDEWRQRIMASHDQMAAQGMRVLGAVSYTHLDVYKRQAR